MERHDKWSAEFEAAEIKKLAEESGAEHPSTADYALANDRIDAQIEDNLLKRIERARNDYYITPEQRTEKPITNESGNRIATAVNTHNWKTRILAYHQQHTVEGEGYLGRRALWLIVDFDDVLNRTTEYQDFLKQKFVSLGLSSDQFDRLYKESKRTGEQDKQVFDYYLFIDQIKRMLPKRAAEIDALLESIDYKKFIDQAVKRALEVIKVKLEPVKISVLTYGDPNYQKARINATGIDEIVDEIIYTEGSKREVIEALRQKQMRQDHPGLEEYKIERASFIVTIDDSPEHLDDYDHLAVERQYANLRFRHPSAKRYGSETNGKEVIELNETEQNQAALNLFRSSLIAQRLGTEMWNRLGSNEGLPHLGHGSDRTQAFDVLKDPSSYPEIMSQMHEDVRDEETYITKASQE